MKYKVYFQPILAALVGYNAQQENTHTKYKLEGQKLRVIQGNGLSVTPRLLALVMDFSEEYSISLRIQNGRINIIFW